MASSSQSCPEQGRWCFIHPLVLGGHPELVPRPSLEPQASDRTTAPPDGHDPAKDLLIVCAQSERPEFPLQTFEIRKHLRE